MKLILYIGHHKVGSTSLQAFLAQNAHKLLQAGILYPAVEPRGLTHMLRQSIGIEDRPGLLPLHLREPHSALAYRMMAETSRRHVPPQFMSMPPLPQMIATLQNQLTWLTPETVIMCSEVFSNFGAVNPALIEQLLALFPQISEIQVYCVFRRPDDYLVSWHGQRLKVGEKLEPLELSLPGYYPTIHFDYGSVIAPWLEACKGATITLRDYGSVMHVGNSVQDFRKQTIVKFPTGLTPPPRINPSLPLSVMDIMRMGNHRLPIASREHLRFFLMQCQDLIDLPPNKDVEMLGADNRAALLDRFQPIHAYLNDIAGTKSFFPDIEQMAQARPLPYQAATKMALDKMTPDVLTHLRDAKTRSFIETMRAKALRGQADLG
jgi:hypothetical protein